MPPRREPTTRAVVPDGPWSSARRRREVTRARASRAHEPEREVGAVADHDIHAEADDAADIGLPVHPPRPHLEASRPPGRPRIRAEGPEAGSGGTRHGAPRLVAGVQSAPT